MTAPLVLRHSPLFLSPGPEFIFQFPDGRQLSRPGTALKLPEELLELLFEGNIRLEQPPFFRSFLFDNHVGRFLLPLAKPALAAVAALTMIMSWNDLLVPLVVINSDKLWPLPLGVMQYQGQYGQDLALVSAFVLLSALPTIIFYLFAERQIVSGLTAGAV
ncbi:MAG: hypothetical protein L6414_06185 [Hydrogenophaga sp.]|uniref:hypothetical protein n=1 Tax=Hydrogenophaga sp. TaxID=1904254 RepID=UPI0025B7B1D2|nr:hypothetical protein [Hydrogenophaga sp.]MCG2655036.1 hypothetical protein [Hydrogenophaga sp.]